MKNFTKFLAKINEIIKVIYDYNIIIIILIHILKYTNYNIVEVL